MNNLVIDPEKFLILIIDDAPQNLKVVGNMLNEVGYRTTFATNGKQALERVKTTEFDLILLDLMMPEMNGLEVCKRFKSEPDYQEIPIIFLTASHEQEPLITAFELGAVDYITKPFNKPELLARVKTHLMLKHTTHELKRALAEVESLARIDPLTFVLNRRTFLELAQQEFERVSRYGSTFSMLILDVDHFKRINDTYGHLLGDRALVTLASVITDSVRSIDTVGRYGGEEFLVLLPDTYPSQALISADRIRSSIAERLILTEKEIFQMTVSIGVATYEKNDQGIFDVLQRADNKLYEAKAQGRNICCI